MRLSQAEREEKQQMAQFFRELSSRGPSSLQLAETTSSHATLEFSSFFRVRFKPDHLRKQLRALRAELERDVDTEYEIAEIDDVLRRNERIVSIKSNANICI